MEATTRTARVSLFPSAETFAARKVAERAAKADRYEAHAVAFAEMGDHETAARFMDRAESFR